MSIINQIKLQVLSKQTLELKLTEIKEICNLKNTHWNYGIKSNLIWFKKNVKKKDIHNMLYTNKKLIGYTLLRNRTFELGKIKKKYLYFDTLIINKKFRKTKLSRILMNFNNQIILKKRKISFLICEKKMIEFYKYFNWKRINKKRFLLRDHKFTTYGMTLNNKNSEKNYKYFFYVYK